MAYTVAFLSGLLHTAIVALVAKFVLRLFAPERPARFGSLCVAAGFVVGRYSYFGEDLDALAALALCRIAGAALALFALWRFVREASPSDAEPR